jgi:hypothetical protein
MPDIGFEQYRIRLIIDYPCEDRCQLCQKLSECIRLYGKTLNMCGKEQMELKEKQK